MSDEKPDGEIPGSDPGKDAPLATTPEADVSQDRTEDEHLYLEHLTPPY